MNQREVFASRVLDSFRFLLPEDREVIRQHAREFFDSGMTRVEAVVSWCSFLPEAGCSLPEDEALRRRNKIHLNITKGS